MFYISGERIKRTWNTATIYKQTHLYRFSENACSHFAAAFFELMKFKSERILRFAIKCGRQKVVVHCGHLVSSRSRRKKSPAGWVVTGQAKESGSFYDWNLYIASDELGFSKLHDQLMMKRITLIDSWSQYHMGVLGDFGVDLELDCSTIKSTPYSSCGWLKPNEMSSEEFIFSDILS